ncbi:DotG/IcmE/VirB10 family protein [Rhizobium leguminosarum]|uniref:DotG/IcmE/VirB10 family protein n=1 Tax=Rhizobium leguminosarum TaxID=384 RepID=UPI002E10E57A|nr:DotG/IcmE/VirB10 family protein [Rhizobium leguminosarum]
MPNFFKKMGETTKGSRKLLLGVAGVAIAAGVYVAFSTPDLPVNNSTVQKGPMSGTPTLQGGDKLPPAYEEELGKADQQRVNAAKNNGGSAIATLRPGTEEQRAPIPLLDPVKEDTPVVETPKIDPAPIVVAAPVVPNVPIVAPPPAIAQASPENLDALKSYMASIRRANPVAEVTTYADMDRLNQQAQAAQTAPAATPVSATADEKSKVKLPLAGKILYAQMVSRANSDSPGPVLAKIVQGEYAGATLIGSFQKAQDSLIISFDRMTVETTRDGEEINETVAIKSVAVSTDYIGTGMATSVDRHMFQKIAIGFTAAFAQGLGEAVSQNGQTTYNTSNGTITTSNDKLDTKEELTAAGGKAVAQTGSILMDEFGRRPTTIIVESGTPIGVLFL